MAERKLKALMLSIMLFLTLLLGVITILWIVAIAPLAYTYYRTYVKKKQ